MIKSSYLASRLFGSGLTLTHQVRVSILYTARCRYSARSLLLESLQNSCVRHSDKKAVIVGEISLTYGDLWLESRKLAGRMWRMCKENHVNLEEKRWGNDGVITVSSLCRKGEWSAVALVACWMCGFVHVPLIHAQPRATLEYYMSDSTSRLVLLENDLMAEFKELVNGLQIIPLIVDDGGTNNHHKSDIDDAEVEDVNVSDEDGGMIIYTSGTTGPPKGVLLTHGNIHNMTQVLVTAWAWCESDVILHVLPLNHLHGLINCLLCPLYVGATCVMHQHFNAEQVWHDLLTTNVNVFMAVPTIYIKLIAEYKKMRDESVPQLLSHKIRLFVSGSAALPEAVLSQWHEISYHIILERYGMSEIGMALSNSITLRLAGYVGQPLKSVEVRLVDDSGEVLVESDGDENVTHFHHDSPCQGELHIKGPSVFKCYWNREEETRRAFTPDGWFRTGDIASCHEILVDDEKRYYFKIVGRQSVDIIKRGGQKLSALDVERAVMCLDWVDDVVVVGVDDAVWGQQVAAMIQPKPGCAAATTMRSDDDVMLEKNEGFSSEDVPLDVLSGPQTGHGESSTTGSVAVIPIQGHGERTEHQLATRKDMILCIAYGANIGGTATLTGTPPNLELVGQLNSYYGHGESGVNFASWLIFSLPTSFITLIVAWFWLCLLFIGFRRLLSCGRSSPDTHEDEGDKGNHIRQVIVNQFNELGPMSFCEIVVLLLFILLVILWISRNPEFIHGAEGWGSLFTQSYVTDSTAALIIAISFFIIPREWPDWTSDEPTKKILDWNTVQHKLPWNVVLLVGAGFAIAANVQSSGLSRWVGEELKVLSGISPSLILFVLCCVVAMATEMASNNAVAVIMIPILKELSENLLVNPLYLMVPCVISASFAFMLPVGTPPNAIVFSTGDLLISDMMKCGFLMNMISISVLQFSINTYGALHFDLDVYPRWANSSDNVTTVTP